MDQYLGKLLDNRYELLEAIGVGGMAMVYKAYCHRLHRFVAVKILRKDLASDGEFRRRFHDEAQAVAMLSHPNIVSIYDVSHDQELEYIVMELIDGITLKQYMKKKGGKLIWREALHYITQIMRALSHAHSRGIIHRDIKPQNIMVLRDGSVRVADFGIARVMSAAQNTLTQEALGSVHYISPEQAKGSHIDARADLYSAGVVLYEMLTGRLPFEGDSPVSVAIQHISSIPLSPRELNEEIPEPLEAITLKAMAPNVERRYLNADEMIRDLEEFRKNPSVNFGYEHQGMLQSDEPTQILDTSSITENLSRRKSAPPRNGELMEDDYDDYDDYRTGSQRRMVDSRRSSKKRSNVALIASVVTLFLIGVGVFLWLFFFSDLFKGEESIYVPSLVGKTLEEVHRDREITEKFDVKQSGVQASSDYEEGEILDQTPKADTEVKGERPEIAVIVSSGRPSVTMKDVVNMSYTEARLLLTELGLTVNAPEYKPHDEIVRDYVISSQPTEGTPMAPGDTVQLVVSTGPPAAQTVNMPYLVEAGYTREEAERALREYGLKCTVSGEVYNDTVEAGKVVSQSVAGGKEVPVGSTIILQISKGPEPPAQKNKTITIPLPSDREFVTVQVILNGEQHYKETVSTAAGRLSVNLSGNGKQSLVVNLDGIPLEDMEQEVDFDI